jgi:hypothetical protein
VEGEMTASERYVMVLIIDGMSVVWGGIVWLAAMSVWD